MFVPVSRSAFVKDLVADTPLVSLLQIVGMLLLGWPAYLVANVSGPAKRKGTGADHFRPASPLFSPRDRAGVLLSDAALLGVLAALAMAVGRWGAAAVAAYYVVPYLVVNLFLVLITFLQHTDTYIPHFREARWSWLQGALATVDRSFGKLLDNRLHHIADTHVCHHVFSKIPFYHAAEATAHLAPMLGRYYLKDETPVPQALWRAWREAKFVEDEPQAVVFPLAPGAKRPAADPAADAGVPGLSSRSSPYSAENKRRKSVVKQT